MSRFHHDQARSHGLKAKVSGWFWSPSPTCREVARLTSEGRDHPLPAGLLLRLALHRSFCPWCARYAQQLGLIHEAAQHFPKHVDQADEATLDAAAKTRLKRTLREAIERQIVAAAGLAFGLMAPALA